MPRKTPQAKARAWVFTLYIDDATEFGAWVPPQPHKFTWLVAGREHCPTTGRLHWQGAVTFAEPREISAAQKSVHPTVKLNMSPMLGTPAEARAYCIKGPHVAHDDWERLKCAAPRYGDDALIQEYGTMPVGRGHRSDLDVLTEAIPAIARGTMSRQDLLHAAPMLIVKYARGIEAAINIENHAVAEELRGTPINIICLWGESGAGKTRYATNEFGRTGSIEFTNGNIWACNAQDCQTALIEEYNGGRTTAETLNMVLDPYNRTSTMPGKGMPSGVARKWTNIILTSQRPPWEWYQSVSDEHKYALARRFKFGANVWHFTRAGVYGPPLPKNVDYLKYIGIDNGPPSLWQGYDPYAAPRIAASEPVQDTPTVPSPGGSSGGPSGGTSGGETGAQSPTHANHEAS